MRGSDTGAGLRLGPPTGVLVMGFGDSLLVRPGSLVTVGGVPREVIQTTRCGRSWPYFQLRGDVQTHFDEGEAERGTSPDWRSWQTCGPLVRQ